MDKLSERLALAMLAKKASVREISRMAMAVSYEPDVIYWIEYCWSNVQNGGCTIFAA
jgi:hypothetical protein